MGGHVAVAEGQRGGTWRQWDKQGTDLKASCRLWSWIYTSTKGSFGKGLIGSSASLASSSAWPPGHVSRYKGQCPCCFLTLGQNLDGSGRPRYLGDGSHQLWEDTCFMTSWDGSYIIALDRNTAQMGLCCLGHDSSGLEPWICPSPKKVPIWKLISWSSWIMEIKGEETEMLFKTRSLAFQILYQEMLMFYPLEHLWPGRAVGVTPGKYMDWKA